VQSQDYPNAKWAVGQRLVGARATEAELDRAFDAGEIIRTHVLRPTWHFVAPEDLRWLLALTGPRVHQASGYQYRLLEIDAALAARARAVIEKALRGGVALTRDELGARMIEAGIEAKGLRLAYLVGHAELEAVICSGPRRGKRQTYALVDERIPPARPRTRDEALAELARRYVEGHGPAQVADLAWWSGLTRADARIALESATPPLVRERHGDRTFWSSPMQPVPRFRPPVVHLLPNYDELLIAFRDRTDAMDPALPPPARVAQVVLAHIVVRDGLGVAGYRRRDEKSTTMVSIDQLVELDSAEKAGIRAAADRFEAFLGRPVELTGLD
jgi:DNA-binding transcriptional ArsR family regulator